MVLDPDGLPALGGTLQFVTDAADWERAWKPSVVIANAGVNIAGVRSMSAIGQGSVRPRF
jgi:hypothetical protein